MSQLQSTPEFTDGQDIVQQALADTRRIMWVGFSILLLGLGGFLLWAAYAPLDEGVPTQGVLTIDTIRKTIQHLNGGIVREVFVKEGGQVEQGQVLMTLEPAMARAKFESVRQHYYGVRAMEGRLLAERRGDESIAFHSDLNEVMDEMLVQQQITTQQQLFHSRREAQRASLAAIETEIGGQQIEIEGLQSVYEQRLRQRTLLQEELAGIRDLVAEGYAPKSKLSELERSEADLAASIADTEARIDRGKSAIEELRQRKHLRYQEYRKEVDGQLAEVRREVQADAEKLVAASEELQRTELRAPASGQVVGLSVQTIGAVVQPAQKLMDIVPNQAHLLLEAQIPPHLSDRVEVGLFCDIRFSAFAHSPQLVVDGKVQSISQDLLTDAEGKVSYYLARIEITEEGLARLGNRRIVPGMPAEVVIKTGERTMLTYLLHPLVRRFAQSMKEE